MTIANLESLQADTRALEIRYLESMKLAIADNERILAAHLLDHSLAIQAVSEALARLLSPVANVPRREMEAFNG